MKKVLSLRFCGTVEHVCTDRNGAHIRLSAYKKYDLLNDVSINVSHKICVDVGYWNGYDYETKTAAVVRSLREGDHIAVSIEKTESFFGGQREEIKVENFTLENYENISEAQDLSALKAAAGGEINESH
jgi:hypothetical protein